MGRRSRANAHAGRRRALIVVDTSVWVEWLRRTESHAHRTLGRLVREGASLGITEVVAMELLAGARDPRAERDLRKGPLSLPVLALDGIADYEAAAELYRVCRRAGEAIRGLSDCLIAVPVIRARASLLQADGDFDRLTRHTRLRIEPLDA